MDVMTKLQWRRRAMKWLRGGLSSVSWALPHETKVNLARRSTKLGHLLARDGEFVFPDYLDTFKVNIDAKYPSDRVMLRGLYEPDLWWAIRRYVSPGNVCLDVGANVGAVTLCLLKALEDRGHIFAFEPGPVFFQRLNNNLALNPAIAGRVTTYNLGVADQKGKLHWAEDPDFPGNAAMFGTRGLEVDVVTLDDFLLPQLTQLDFVKIDVEGMELEVLTGARQLIRRFRPKIFFETILDFETFRGRPIRQLSERLLRDLGYRLFKISADGNLEPVVYPHFSQNTLALPEV
jgi:FkbM family methyltransferase